jgi:hypothetical protein
VYGRRKQPVSDQPIRLLDRLAPRPLLDERAEYAGDRLVECAGLALIREPRIRLGHPVGQLVGDDVETAAEPAQIAIRVDEAMAEQLRLRAALELAR